MRGITRIICVWLLFGMGAEALHGLGEGVAVILSAIMALAVNRMWRDQQRKDLAREHREAVEADEELRAQVRARLAERFASLEERFPEEKP
jgi:hypothetical protein